MLFAYWYEGGLPRGCWLFMALSEVEEADADEVFGGAVPEVGESWPLRSLVAPVPPGGATPLVEAAALVGAGGGVRVVVEEFAWAVRELLEDLRVLPTNLRKRLLKEDWDDIEAAHGKL